MDVYILRAFLSRFKGIQELLDSLTAEAVIQSAEAIESDWKSAVWELLLLIVYNLSDLGLSIPVIKEHALLPVLALVELKTEASDRCMALRFLLAEPIRCIECQDCIVDNAGLSRFVNALAVECDAEASQLLLDLLHQVSVTSPSYEQEISLTLQGIVDSDDSQRSIQYGNLLLLANQALVPAFPASATAADRNEQLAQLVLQASTNALYVASSSVMVKYMALKSVRKALPEIGFAFVFNCEGIALLWDILMQNDGRVKTLAVDILRYLAREDDAFRDHILEFYSQYTCVEDADTKFKAAAMRLEIFEKQINTRHERVAQISELEDDSAQAVDAVKASDSECQERESVRSRNGAIRSDEDWEFVY